VIPTPGERTPSRDHAVRPLRLSVLDQSPIAEGSTGAQALERTLELAALADRLGFHRTRGRLSVDAAVLDRCRRRTPKQDTWPRGWAPRNRIRSYSVPALATQRELKLSTVSSVRVS
jgi:hypothetical protein